SEPSPFSPLLQNSEPRSENPSLSSSVRPSVEALPPSIARRGFSSSVEPMRPHPLLQSSSFIIACSPSPPLHLAASSWSLAAVVFVVPFLKFSYLCSASGLRLNHPGFRPKNQEAWNLRDGSDGCVRNTGLNCSTDKFLHLENMKLPETSSVFMNMSITLDECGSLCKRNCSCTAYANIDIRNGETGYVMWIGQLFDMNEHGCIKGLQPLVANSESKLVIEQLLLKESFSSATVLEAKKWLQKKKSGLEPNSDLGYGRHSLDLVTLTQVPTDEGSPMDVAKSYIRSLPPWASPSLDHIKPPTPVGIQLFKEQTPHLFGGNSTSSSKCIVVELRDLAMFKILNLEFFWRPFCKMGTGHVNENGGGDIGSNNGGSGGYCDMSYYSCIFSSGFIFFFGCFVFFESIAILYGWLTFLPAVHMGLSTVGCQEDNKGSWSIEIFYGESPFTLKPMKS
ncbi:hypothetical protein S245_039803, partial [Arachis hypogaea]